MRMTKEEFERRVEADLEEEVERTRRLRSAASHFLKGGLREGDFALDFGVRQEGSGLDALEAAFLTRSFKLSKETKQKYKKLKAAEKVNRTLYDMLQDLKRMHVRKHRGYVSEFVRSRTGEELTVRFAETREVCRRIETFKVDGETLVIKVIEE